MKQYEAYPNLGKLFQVIATASGVRPHVEKAGRYTRDKDLSQRKINDPKKAEEIISELFIQPLKNRLWKWVLLDCWSNHKVAVLPAWHRATH